MEKIKLVRTCGACPEQYDAFLGKRQVGYLRLRHGYFSVSFGGVSGNEIYHAYPNGDGMFETHERDMYLQNAVSAIRAKLREEEGEQVEDQKDYYVVNGEI